MSTSAATAEAVIRACFRAYETKDRAALEPLLTEDFTFSSPLDDRISRARYFERCWPNSAHTDRVDIEKFFFQGEEAVVQYRFHPTGRAPFRNTEIFTLRDGRISHVDVYFGAESTPGPAPDAAIRAVLDAYAEALRRRDVDAVTQLFAADSVRFELAPPLIADQPLRAALNSWFASWQGDRLGYEIHDLAITAADGVAYTHALHHLTGTKLDGQPADVWFRATLCLRQIETHWRITHLHESVPFYMDGSFRAAVDLRPEA